MHSRGVSGRNRGRDFDPRKVGARECRAWVTYYRRLWGSFLIASVGMVHAGFRMSWWRTLWGAWLVLRANQHWAPFPDNDPDRARRCMARFYRAVAASAGEELDHWEAARLEVDWWRAHRAVQHDDATTHDDAKAELVDALVRLYAFVYRTDPADVRLAAQLRADAMDVSDRWVAEGCHEPSPLIAQERSLLVRSYAALLAAVHR